MSPASLIHFAGAKRPAPSPTELAVLDTQVVLDWLVFRDASTLAMSRAIENGTLHWLASQAMQDEIEHVLNSGIGAKWQPDRAAIRTTIDRWVRKVDSPAISRLRCSDPDDQMFIDLALAAGARWLFTRDKALLRLARRASENGVCVLRPAAWQQQPGG